LAEFFVGGVTARSGADLARVNRKTAAYFFHRLRQIIARQLEESLPVEGLVAVDESYFGSVRKGKRGRGAGGKIPVFGILKRGTMMIPDVRKDILLPIIRRKVVPDSIVYTDSYPAYDVLDVSELPTSGSTTQTPMFSIATITSRAFAQWERLPDDRLASQILDSL
jgi:transposase